MVGLGAVPGLAIGMASIRYIQSLLHRVRLTELAVLAFPSLTIFTAASLKRALVGFIAHYHSERPHQGKGNVLLFPARQPGVQSGAVVCTESLGGFLKYYARAA